MSEVFITSFDFSDQFALHAKMADTDAWSSVEARSTLHQMLVHSADISNPARPWARSSVWSHRVLEGTWGIFVQMCCTTVNAMTLFYVGPWYFMTVSFAEVVMLETFHWKLFHLDCS